MKTRAATRRGRSPFPFPVPECAEAKKQSPRPGPGALTCRAQDPRQKSALAELLATTRLVEANLLAFHFAGIASHQTSALELGLQRFIVVDEGAGDAVTHCTCLAAFATTMHVDVEIKRFEVVGEARGLALDVAAGFTSEVFVDGLAVDDDLARTFLQVHTSDRSLAAAGAIVPITDHDLSLDFQRFGLLSGVRMLFASINLEFLG